MYGMIYYVLNKLRNVLRKKKYRKPNECVVIYWSSVDDLNNNNKRTHVHITNVVLRTKSTHKRIVRVRSIH